VAKSEEVKTGFNLAESSKVGYGSKRAVLPMMMMFSVGVDAFHAVKNPPEYFIVLFSAQTVFCSETQVSRMKDSVREGVTTSKKNQGSAGSG
jgi:hypothetical protein